jgi:glyoxylate/hydroxypyruvate reductase
MTSRDTTLLLAAPITWADRLATPLAEIAPEFKVFVRDRDCYEPEAVDYVLGTGAAPGFLSTLPNLKLVFSLGAGVDGFLSDPYFPKQVPLVRFVDRNLSRAMTQYIVLQVLIHYRQQRLFDLAQAERKWEPMAPPRCTEETRIGILGLGEIGRKAGERLRDLDFDVAGWSRSRKALPGIESFAGADELKPFLSRTDILVCVLPLTPDTSGVLNQELFSVLPQDAFVINVARGGHLVERDLIESLDSGHLSGAALDVFAVEPLPKSSPLWTHPKVTITPHVAGVANPRAASLWVRDTVARYKSREPIANVVDFTRGY